MARIVIYNLENNILKEVIFTDKVEDSPKLVGEAIKSSKVTDLVSMFSELSELGLGVFIDLNYVPNEGESASEYGYGYSYEVNISSYGNFGTHKVTRIQALTSDFDDEELDKLLEVDSIREIYEKDAKFRRLIDQVRIVDADWSAIVNYLNKVYAFEFTFITYNNEENS